MILTLGYLYSFKLHTYFKKELIQLFKWCLMQKKKKGSSPTALHFKHSVLVNYIFPTEILLCSSSTIILVRERQKVNPGSLFLIILVLLVQEFSRQGRRCSLGLASACGSQTGAVPSSRALRGLTCLLESQSQRWGSHARFVASAWVTAEQGTSLVEHLMVLTGLRCCCWRPWFRWAGSGVTASGHCWAPNPAVLVK